MNKNNMLVSVGLAVLALTPPLAARAADNNSIGEVVVTATKTGATNLQKTPIAVSVVGGDTLDTDRAVTLRDLQTAVADLKITSNGSNAVLYVRGVGGYASNNEQDVGVYLDGVYLGRTNVALESNFNDIERVEVAAGPQGTTFGRNAVGGAVNFISRQPSKDFEMQDTLNLGNYNLIDDAFRMSGPVTDKLGASIALGYAKHDGYLINVNPGAGAAGGANRFNSRFEMKYEITPDMTNLVRADYMYTNEHWAPLTTLKIRSDDPRTLTCSIPSGQATIDANEVCKYNGYPAPLANAQIGNYHYYGAGGTPNNSDIAYGINDEFNWKINDNISVKNLVAYRTDRAIWLTTGNGTEFLNGATRSNYYQHQFSDELDFAHTFGNLKGVVGLYGWTEFQRPWADSITITNPAVLKTSAGSDSYQDTRFPTQSYAVYANETYQITPDIGIVGGARFTAERKVLDTLNTSYTWIGTLPAGWPGVPAGQGGSRGAQSASVIVCYPSTVVPTPTPPSCTGGAINYYQSAFFPFVLGYGNNFPGSPPDGTQNTTAFTPKVGINWQATKDAFLYFSYTRGFKSGGFNFTARSFEGDSYLPEYITTYEVGAKTDWLDHHLRINVAVYRNDWTNLQVSQTVVLPGLTTPYTQSSNAASARLTGMDADVTYKPWDGWTFTGSVSWLPDAVYLNYTGGQAGTFIKYLLEAEHDPRESLAAGTYNASGNRIINAPDVSALVSGQKDFDLGNGNTAFIRGEAQYTGNTQFDISDNSLTTRNPFAVFNASIGYASPGGHYRVQLWGRNITDTQYFISESAGNTVEGVPGAPRTFGVQLIYNY